MTKIMMFNFDITSSEHQKISETLSKIYPKAYYVLRSNPNKILIAQVYKENNSWKKAGSANILEFLETMLEENV